MDFSAIQNSTLIKLRREIHSTFFGAPVDPTMWLLICV